MICCLCIYCIYEFCYSHTVSLRISLISIINSIYHLQTYYIMVYLSLYIHVFKTDAQSDLYIRTHICTGDIAGSRVGGILYHNQQIVLIWNSEEDTSTKTHCSLISCPPRPWPHVLQAMKAGGVRGWEWLYDYRTEHISMRYIHNQYRCHSWYNMHPPLIAHHPPGATIISCLTVRILRKERSLVGSRSLTVVRDLAVSWWISPAYCTVVALSRVLRMGMPTLKRRNSETFTK